MVPSPLSHKSLAGRRYPLSISEAISSAASPLQNSFQLSCRSPLSPRVQTLDGYEARDAIRFSQGSSLAPPRFSHLLAEGPASSELVLTNHRPDSGVEDTVSSYTTYSPTDHILNLPPITPTTLLHGAHQDDGHLGVVSVINLIVGKTVGVGAYTVPSAIFDGVGSVGMSLLVWVIGSIISFCGLAVYLDLGTAMPRSGGERVYLERIFRRPRMLATCMFMSYVVLLGFSTPNAIVLGDYVLYALDMPRDRWNVRIIAVMIVSALCYTHARFPKAGLRMVNGLGIGKLLILGFVISCGAIGGLVGIGRMETGLDSRRLDLPLSHDWTRSTAQRNFTKLWEGSSTQPYDYATALLKVIYCFRGYSTANQVLSDVRNPVRTLKVAAPVALCIISFAYLALNVAFFLVVDKDDFKSAGVVVAGTFFRNIFGDVVGKHVLPVFVIISAAGNIAATSFAQARVNEELAKDGLLPCSSFWTSKPAAPRWMNGSVEGRPSPSLAGTTPSRGLLLHWVVSVAVIIVPPPGKIYNFLVDIGGYPVSVVSVAISLGLIHLRWFRSQEWSSPFRASRLAVIVFALSNILLLIFPWVPSASGQGEAAGIPYYAYPATALAVLGSGAVYWCWWTTRGNGRKDASRRRARWAKVRQSDSAIQGVLFEEDRASKPRGHVSSHDLDIRRQAPCECPVDH